MDILSKTDDEIYELAKPIWDNLIKSSNMKDYGGFTKNFSTQMLFGANEVELGKQWANNKIITNLKETFEPFGCLRRGIHVTVLIKQTNKEITKKIPRSDAYKTNENSNEDKQHRDTRSQQTLPTNGREKRSRKHPRKTIAKIGREKRCEP